MNETISLAPYLAAARCASHRFRWTGQVTEVAGLLIESRGPSAAIGDFCEVAADGRRIRTQVIGFRNGRVLSMPLEEIDGLQLGDAVTARSEEARVEVGAGLLGRVIDGFGKPMDGGPPIDARRCLQPLWRSRRALWTASTSPSRWSPASAPSTAAALRHRAAHRHFRRQRSREEHATRLACRGTIRPMSR